MTNKPNGYWTEEIIISKLQIVINEFGHFPTITELIKNNMGDLKMGIFKNGGINYFRDKMGYELLNKPNGYWTEEIIISELKVIINEFSHFPTNTELIKNNMGDLKMGIFKNGGINYFRDKMGYELLNKPNGYWTEEIIISELKVIINEFSHFPTNTELIKNGRGDLVTAIKIHSSGLNHLRDKMGYKYYKSPSIWTEEYIISKLEQIIKEIDHFPTASKLRDLGLHGLVKEIFKKGGSNYFREIMGYNTVQKSLGFWTEEIIISELKLVIEELGHPPSYSEMNKISRGDLAAAININGGIVYLMEKYGISPSIQEKYKSELSSYVNKRGRKTEQFVKNIIAEWTEIHNTPAPNCNVKLSKGNIIEFICDFDKKIGIDVTNTKASKSSVYTTIQHKWKHKDYCLYLDELWIVVFTDILTPADYEKLNVESPENVKVFSIEDFLRELDYSTENMGKIDRLKECSFHNKEEIINPNRTFDGEY